MNLVISRLARKDQDEIFKFAFDHWGRDQLQRYIGGLLDEFDEIAEERTMGRTVRGLPSRFRRIAYGSHFIFYAVADEQVKIERILHQRMDFAGRIG